MRRVVSTELLDEDAGTPREIADSLDDLWRINRWLGGVSSTLRMFERLRRQTGAQSIRVLDVGAGDGRLALHVRQKLARHGVQATFVVLDRRFGHLSNAPLPMAQVLPVVADALQLPFLAESFDVVMCNLFFHHFSDAKAVALLRGLAHVAKQAVLVNDLERHGLPYLFIRLVPLFKRGRLTRHDAPASVRQAYTRRELARLARAAGFADFEVRRLVPFRLGLTLWKSGLAALRQNGRPIDERV